MGTCGLVHHRDESWDHRPNPGADITLKFHLSRDMIGIPKSYMQATPQARDSVNEAVRYYACSDTNINGEEFKIRQYNFVFLSIFFQRFSLVNISPKYIYFHMINTVCTFWTRDLDLENTQPRIWLVSSLSAAKWGTWQCGVLKHLFFYLMIPLIIKLPKNIF